jgi:hypothetical protein
MKQSIVILETIDIADGSLRKKSVAKFDSHIDAICEAWHQHKAFLGDRKSGEFDLSEPINSDDVHFGHQIGKDGIVVAFSADRSVCRIYSITRASMSVAVEV